VVDDFVKSTGVRLTRKRFLTKAAAATFGFVAAATVGRLDVEAGHTTAGCCKSPSPICSGTCPTGGGCPSGCVPGGTSCGSGGAACWCNSSYCTQVKCCECHQGSCGNGCVCGGHDFSCGGGCGKCREVATRFLRRRAA